MKFKDFGQKTDVLLSVLIITVALVSFSLGRISSKEAVSEAKNSTHVSSIVNSKETPEKQESIEKIDNNQPQTTLTEKGGYVASKNGTKYHLPWCGGAKRIKEENKVYFKTKEEAEKAGYTPASNCKGI